MSFKDKLASGSEVLTAHLCTIPSAVVTQAIAAGGADAVVVDFEHGAVDYSAAHAMFAAVAGTGCAPFARVSALAAAEVKRVLDLGAEGIVFPLIRTAEDAAFAVSTLRYPPAGQRGFGPFLAAAHHATSLMGYREAVAQKIVAMLLIETVEAVENIEAICAVEGIDLLIPAPFDLSTALGIPGQFEHPDFLSAVAKVEAAAAQHGIPLGNVGLSEAQARQWMDRGYRVICGFDVLWLRAQAEATQAWVSA